MTLAPSVSELPRRLAIHDPSIAVLVIPAAVHVIDVSVAKRVPWIRCDVHWGSVHVLGVVSIHSREVSGARAIRRKCRRQKQRDQQTRSRKWPNNALSYGAGIGERARSGHEVAKARLVPLHDGCRRRPWDRSPGVEHICPAGPSSGTSFLPSCLDRAPPPSPGRRTAPAGPSTA